jgi:hypothetical protein
LHVTSAGDSYTAEKWDRAAERHLVGAGNPQDFNIVRWRTPEILNADREFRLAIFNDQSRFGWVEVGAQFLFREFLGVLKLPFARIPEIDRSDAQHQSKKRYCAGPYRDNELVVGLDDPSRAYEKDGGRILMAFVLTFIVGASIAALAGLTFLCARYRKNATNPTQEE